LQVSRIPTDETYKFGWLQGSEKFVKQRKF
jgi:hypothetical protein